MVEPELLNNTQWDERDLTNSSSERVIFPKTCVMMDHILKVAEGIISNLRSFFYDCVFGHCWSFIYICIKLLV